MQELKIGDGFIFNNKIIEVVEGSGTYNNDCIRCHFHGENFTCEQIKPSCQAFDRQDGKNVVYMQIKRGKK